MEVKLFYRTQRDLAIALNELVDAYWDGVIKENEFIHNIKLLHKHNAEKLLKQDKFTTVVQQQCGKRRLAVVDQIINMQ